MTEVNLDPCYPAYNNPDMAHFAAPDRRNRLAIDLATVGQLDLPTCTVIDCEYDRDSNTARIFLMLGDIYTFKFSSDYPFLEPEVYITHDGRSNPVRLNIANWSPAYTLHRIITSSQDAKHMLGLSIADPTKQGKDDAERKQDDGPLSSAAAQ